MSAHLWVAPAAVSEEAAPEAVPVERAPGPESRVQGPEGAAPAVAGLQEARGPAVVKAIGVRQPRGPRVRRNLAATTRNPSELRDAADTRSSRQQSYRPPSPGESDRRARW